MWRESAAGSTLLKTGPSAVAPYALSAGEENEIRERKRAEEKVRQMNEDLERRVAERTVELTAAKEGLEAFNHSISHEMRTPLNAIIGFTGILLMKLPGPLTEEQTRQLETIDRSSKHLLSLINDMLDLAKIESGKAAFTLEPLALQILAEEVCNTLRPLAEKKGLQLSLVVRQDQPILNSDRRAVSQILLNLTSNAIKFTDQGEVRVEVGCEMRHGKSWMQLSVNDTGIGIRPEDQPKIFRAFSQIEANRRRQEGTGLGLHLSQKLAQLLGGGISFKSEYGRGSTFTLFLPDA